MRRDAQRTADLGAAIDHDHPYLGVRAQNFTQARGHFGGGLDAGEAASGNDHGVARCRFRQLVQRADMRLKAHGLVDVVDVEGVFDARQGGASNLAAAGEDQAVEAQGGDLTAGISVIQLAPVDVDLLGAALDEGHAHGAEQVAQRRGHLVHVRLVEARADAQFGLRGEHSDFDVAALVQIEQARGAQGAPHTRETGADDQDALFHGLSDERMNSGCRVPECPTSERFASRLASDNCDYICRSYPRQLFFSQTPTVRHPYGGGGSPASVCSLHAWKYCKQGSAGYNPPGCMLKCWSGAGCSLIFVRLN